MKKVGKASLKRGDDDEEETVKRPDETQSMSMRFDGKRSGSLQEHTPPNKKRRSEDPRVQVLMQRIRNYFSDTEPTEATIDVEQAMHLLEASSGDLDKAAEFFWDEYFASTAAQDQSRSRGSSDQRPGKRGYDENLGNGTDPLEEEEEEDDDDEEVTGIQDVPPDPPAAAIPAAEPAVEQQNVADNVAGSVSVSDDEATSGGVWRLTARRRDGGRNRRAGQNRLSRSVSDRVEANKDESETEKSGSEQSSFDDEFLSDEELLPGSDSSLSSQQPSGLLWGLQQNVSGGSSGDFPNNVVDDDDDESQLHPQLQPCIPPTWLHAGFTMSSCGGGLVLNAPTDEDVAIHRWRLSQVDGGAHSSRHVLLPPFHCKSITGVLAVVNAVMLSGASIQGQHVNCRSNRTPFSDLSEKERKDEFESRLAEALSALLLVAFKASSERKHRALAKRQVPTVGRTDLDQLRDQLVKRRLRLVATCRWKVDAATGEALLPEGRDPRNVRICTSYSNINDLKNYVLSNMRSFTGRGGCALFLETVLKIHGRGSIERMMKRSRQKPCRDPLLNCTCEERQKSMAKGPNPAQRNILDSTPPGHSCMSIELLSLLLTGKIHSTLKGWTSCLGVGVLSNKANEVGRMLKRPEKPVWIVRGNTCYSLLWLRNEKDMELLDDAGQVMDFEHWNSWYGQANKSALRVTTRRAPWVAPTLLKRKSSPQRKTVVESIFERRKQQIQCTIVSGDEDEDGDPDTSCSVEELERVREHPDDRRFYPNQYNRWRFDVNGDGGWQPFYKLSKREKLVVETKVAPRINHIVRTRWSEARIEHLSKDPPVV